MNLPLQRKHIVFTFPICLFWVVLEKLVENMEGYLTPSFGCCLCLLILVYAHSYLFTTLVQGSEARFLWHKVASNRRYEDCIHFQSIVKLNVKTNHSLSGFDSDKAQFFMYTLHHISEGFPLCTGHPEFGFS